MATRGQFGGWFTRLGAPRAGLVLAGLLFSPHTESSGQSWPASQPGEGFQLPSDVMQALAGVTDLAFDFDQPGFYAVLDHVRRNAQPPSFAAQAEPVDDWRAMLERPRHFRGRPVRVTGVVGRNSSWSRRDDRAPPQAPVWQLELHREAQPIFCTVIFTEPADDIPLGATLDVAGYFVLVRQYYDSRQRPRQAALIVARGPLSVGLAAPPVDRPSRFSWRWILAAAMLGFLIAWVVLRRGAGRSERTNLRELQASRPAPESLATDLRDLARVDDEAGKQP